MDPEDTKHPAPAAGKPEPENSVAAKPGAPVRREMIVERVIGWCSQNHFLVVVGVLFLIVAGVIALQRVRLDAIPDLSDVQVIVFTEWPGRDPQLVEDQITYPIVSALAAAPSVKYVRGQTFFGLSFVNVIFEDGTDMYWARSRVLEYLNQVMGDLPPGIRPTLGPDATGVGWIFEYALVDETGQNSLADLRTLQDWTLRYYLQNTPGVAEVASVGGFVREYQVDVDPNKLLAYHIPLPKLVMAIRDSNNDVGGRVIEFGETEYMVKGVGYIKSLEDIEKVAIGGKTISWTVEGRERYPINVRYARDHREDLPALRRVLVPTPTGAQVPMEQLADIALGTGPPGYFLSWGGQYQYMLKARETLKLVIPLIGGMVSSTVLTLILIPVIYFLWRSRGVEASPTEAKPVRKLLMASIIMGALVLGGGGWWLWHSLSGPSKPTAVVTTQTVGPYQFKVLGEGKQFRMGDNAVRIEVTDATGKPVDVGSVWLELRMDMPGMAASHRAIGAGPKPGSLQRLHPAHRPGRVARQHWLRKPEGEKRGTLYDECRPLSGRYWIESALKEVVEMQAQAARAMSFFLLAVHGHELTEISQTVIDDAKKLLSAKQEKVLFG